MFDTGNKTHMSCWTKSLLSNVKREEQQLIRQVLAAQLSNGHAELTQACELRDEIDMWTELQSSKYFSHYSR